MDVGRKLLWLRKTKCRIKNPLANTNELHVLQWTVTWAQEPKCCSNNPGTYRSTSNSSAGLQTLRTAQTFQLSEPVSVGNRLQGRLDHSRDDARFGEACNVGSNRSELGSKHDPIRMTDNPRLISVTRNQLIRPSQLKWKRRMAAGNPDVARYEKRLCWSKTVTDLNKSERNDCRWLFDRPKHQTAFQDSFLSGSRNRHQRPRTPLNEPPGLCVRIAKLQANDSWLGSSPTVPSRLSCSSRFRHRYHNEHWSRVTWHMKSEVVSGFQTMITEMLSLIHVLEAQRKLI